jgi:hypothetical protein
MLSWLKQLDALLRGQSTDPLLLQRGAAELAVKRFVTISLVLGSLYGFFMGWYAVATRDSPSGMQLLASTVKLPLLFLLTLLVSFPSLYVFSALTGCRLSFAAVLRLLVATITVNLAVAASMGPILGFFTLSTESYSFIILLNVALLGVAGFVSLGFLLNTLRRLARAFAPPPPPFPPPLPRREPLRAYEATSFEAEGEGGLNAPPMEPLGTTRPMFTPAARAPEEPGYGVFYVWIIIYGLVGAQMGWLLRPFIGHPNMPFQWFRPRSGNFFEAVWTQFWQLVGG